MCECCKMWAADSDSSGSPSSSVEADDRDIVVFDWLLDLDDWDYYRILEAVELADPAFGVVAAGGGLAMAQRPPAPLATVHIVEQPAPKALRFRYECEGRSAGSIPGVNSSPENKTYPAIRISGFHGQATIVVSCVTKDDPYRPHPHNLVGREGCQRGVFTFKATISPETSEYHFRNLGIQCVKRRDISEALRQRELLRVDPFRTGFEHRNNPQSIDLNAVRLAFQVFLHEEGGGPRLYSLPAVVSDVIYDKKAMCDLLIMRASHCSGTVAGGTQIILLCEKVTREDTAVVFYQEDGAGRVVWEAPATTVLVHKQVAIVFETPAYTAPHYEPRTHRGQIHVRFQLKRITDNQRSNSLDFEYIQAVPDSKKRKAVMAELTTYDAESYGLEPPIKIEPNRTPPHIYTQPGPYSEAQAQWKVLEPLPPHGSPYGEGWAGAGAQFPQYGQASPYHRSPHHHQGGQGSPLGAMSPHANLQSPLAPTVAALSPQPALSPSLHGPGGPGGPSLSPSLHYQPGPPLQPPPYQLNQMGGEQMDTGTSFSALLNQDVGPLPEHELFSLPSLEQTQENLSDSLRNLSTTDLLFRAPDGDARDFHRDPRFT